MRRMEHLTLVLGPAYSGKSFHARTLLDPQQPAHLLLTTEPGSFGQDDAQAPAIADSVAKGAIDRGDLGDQPGGWMRRELRRSSSPAWEELFRGTSQVLIDSLSLHIARWMVQASSQVQPVQAEGEIHGMLDGLIEALSGAQASVVVVSAEVGASLPANHGLARDIRRLTGLANQRLASQAGRVLVMVAGIPLQVR